MNKFNIAFLFLVITIIACSCSRQPVETPPPWEHKPITHPSLIGSEDCRPPCWEGITPDRTTFNQAMSIIADMLNTHPDGEFKSSYVNEQKYISWVGDRWRQADHVSVHFNGMIVQHMRLDFEDIDLGSFVEKFGDPHGYEFFYDPPGGFGVICYYPSVGIAATAIKFVGSSEEEWIITKDMDVFKIHFLSPGDPEDFPAKLSEFESFGIGNNSYDYDYFPWEGFGIDVLGNH